MSRIFANFEAAINELRRDLSELSVDLLPTTWQGRSVADDLGFRTKELQNYLYTVTDPDPNVGLRPTQPWAAQELEERLSGDALNPGKAYLSRPEVWDELLEKNGQFSYTYSERLWGQLASLIEALQEHKFSRQIFLSIWDIEADPYQLERRRVPCSLGYYFQYRNGALNMTYLQRSCDFSTHYDNDVWLAVKILRHVAAEVNLPCGMFSHWIGSLHVFAKDVEGVF